MALRMGVLAHHRLNKIEYADSCWQEYALILPILIIKIMIPFSFASFLWSQPEVQYWPFPAVQPTTYLPVAVALGILGRVHGESQASNVQW